MQKFCIAIFLRNSLQNQQQKMNHVEILHFNFETYKIFGRTGPTGQRGPPLEVDHFDRKISTWAEPFHLRLDRNFRKFLHNGKHPQFYSLPFVQAVASMY